jgi:hypothetical protein
VGFLSRAELCPDAVVKLVRRDVNIVRLEILFLLFEAIECPFVCVFFDFWTPRGELERSCLTTATIAAIITIATTAIAAITPIIAITAITTVTSAILIVPIT